MELPKLQDGSINPKYVDLLDEDKPIANQKWGCFSFVDPEDIIKNKEMFFFEDFVKQWDFSKSLEKFHHFIAFLSYKYNLNNENILKDLEEFVIEEKDNLTTTTFADEYKTYIDNNEDKLTEQYKEQHSFQTSTRGFKCRGVFPSVQEAELRCKLLRESDPNHDIHVGPIGMWIPWNPKSYKTGRTEYMEPELNQIMHEKAKNEKKAKEEFDNRVKEAKEKAIEENKQKALESGNKLTQMLNEDGELVNIANTTTFGNLGNVTNAEELKNTLFNDENIVTSTDNDHGISNLTENIQENTDKDTNENSN